jgi:toxin ParE1/3/4
VTYDVSIHPLARADLFDLYRYIEEQSGPVRAGGYIERIEQACRSLGEFPHRGTAREDIGSGIRTTSIERRVLIAVRILAEEVVILRVLYAGRNFGAEEIAS